MCSGGADTTVNNTRDSQLLTSWTSGMSTSPCAMPGASYAHDWPLRPALRGSLHAGTGAPFSDVHFAIANKFQPDWQKPKSGQSEKACEKLASYSRARNSNGSKNRILDNQGVDNARKEESG